MTDQVEAYQTAGGEFIAWQYDRRGFPIALYSGDTVDQAVERMLADE